MLESVNEWMNARKYTAWPQSNLPDNSDSGLLVRAEFPPRHEPQLQVLDRHMSHSMYRVI